jgi:glycosyltransferase involved in cell wall biosynthesis
MNILRVITRMNVGGPAHQVRYLHQQLSELGHSCTLVMGRLDDGEGDSSGDLMGAEGVIYLPHLCRPIRPHDDLRALFRLWELIVSEPFEVCHTHTAKAGLLTRLAVVLAKPWRKLKKFPKIKVVHTYHGHVFQGYFSPQVSKLIKHLERWLAAYTDILITLSPKLNLEIQAHLKTPQQNFRVVPLGLNLEGYLKLQRQNFFEPQLPDKLYIIGWVGRFAAIKNPLRFVAMAEKIGQILGDSVGFVMVGDGVLRPHIEEVVQERHLAAHFYFTGWRNDLECIYAGFDALINTSDNEGTPVAILEALCAGVPVAASDVGGCREILNLLHQPVHCFDVNQSDASCEILTSWLLTRRRIDEATRISISRQYSHARLLDDLVNIYSAKLL